MRSQLVPVGLLALAACSGGGPQTVGSNAVPGATGSAGTAAAPSQYAEFAKPSSAHTYVGIGGTQKYTYHTDSRVAAGQQSQLYAGNATTVRDSGISVSYDPRDGIYTLAVADTKSGASTSIRFQDPAHRTDFGGAVRPQWGVPNLNQRADKNVRYLEVGNGTGVIYPTGPNEPPFGDAGSSTDQTTMFFEVPGTTTRFVGYAGYIRNRVSTSTVTIATAAVTQQTFDIERGAFAFGAQTAQASVPKIGQGRYSGSMLATMVNNPTIDGENGAIRPSYFQWIDGTSNIDIDFAASTVALSMNGIVSAAQVDRYTSPIEPYIAAGSTFAATGTAAIDLVNTGGFAGTISEARFTNAAGQTLQRLTPPASVRDSTKVEGVIAGSSVNGAFYGPGGTIAETEVGGGFRIVGGTPDQRIDIVGAFTGAPR